MGRANATARSAEFPASGFLAWEKSMIKESVLGVLDGGEAALLARQKKYGHLMCVTKRSPWNSLAEKSPFGRHYWQLGSRVASLLTS